MIRVLLSSIALLPYQETAVFLKRTILSSGGVGLQQLLLDLSRPGCAPRYPGGWKKSLARIACWFAQGDPAG